MFDQATELRRMMAESAHPRAAGDQAEPRIVVLAGAAPGQGGAALARVLAHALAAEAQRVVLADCDLRGAELTKQAGAQGAPGLAEVLAGKLSIHETLERGSGGIQFLPGSLQATTDQTLSDRSARRFAEQLQALGNHADWIIVDAGCEVNLLVSRLAAVADPLWILAEPDSPSIMNAYILVKTLATRRALRRPVEVLVAGANAPLAAEVHQRLDRSCRRFLGLAVHLAGIVPAAISADEPGERSAPGAAWLQPLIERLDTARGGSGGGYQRNQAA